MRSVSIGTMIRLLSDHLSLSPIDRAFVREVARDSNDGADTSALSGDQVDRVEAIFKERM
jgi:hypothetical protein